MADMNKIKAVIDKHIGNVLSGIFNTRNVVGDTMETIYNDGEVQIDVCWDWEYFEVFGLSEEQFDELFEYYYERERKIVHGDDNA